MRALVIATAIAVATVLIAAAPGAEAAYISPDAPWTVKAFCQSGC